MFNRQKIATVSGLVGSLAVICSGVAHAHADEFPGDCKTSLAETTCISKSESIRTSKDGKYVVKQTQDCKTTDRQRVVFPENYLLGGGSRKVGPVVDCSNRTPLPKGVKVPHPKLPRPTL
ncbi:hypothetical protein J2Z21_003358 [Streptomyces griseochromogenes]|uniref:Uncharacterized protein n=1 Tax=Streptomyces griseochromogenes TaxID=68214 RepID=A0A1B1B8N3_9ACTN|nr:hypothetical protein [Streptomyces griseochromogenes]ANP55149.1 hypothetical protein AVL59_41145 [Streptomyces griseochromogenes]MBP2050419.1 hypothetical protein [Streptomyces griseochromogenes]